MSHVKSIAKKWYYRLGFPKDMDTAFESILFETEIEESLTLETYDLNEQNGQKNLVCFLYFCESLTARYKAMGIPEKILLDTLCDIVTWTKIWSGIKKTLYLGEIRWLSRHLSMRLFKLGRLQFCMADSEFSIPEVGLAEGDAVVEIHIPEGPGLTHEACLASFAEAKDFFEAFFPQYRYSLFTCHSWLLDTSLQNILPEGSNILNFAKHFTVVREDPSDALLGYLFVWETKRDQLKALIPRSSLAAAVKDRILAGERFHESLGYIVK